MNKVITFVGSIGLLVGLSQVSLGQVGTLALATQTSAPYGGVGLIGNGLYAGTFLMTFTPTGGSASAPFLTYCTDLNVDLHSPFGANKLDTTSFVPQGYMDTDYDVNYTPNEAADDVIVGGELAWIANTYGQTGNPDANAAAQIAIWDIAEGGVGTVGDGFFLSNGFNIGDPQDFSGFPIGIVDTAELEAAAAFHGGNGHEMQAVDTWYKAESGQQGGSNQDFLTPSGSPEPFTMGIGAAGICLALIRRIKRSV